jgi:hypothetical protein
MSALPAAVARKAEASRDKFEKRLKDLEKGPRAFGDDEQRPDEAATHLGRVLARGQSAESQRGADDVG